MPALSAFLGRDRERAELADRIAGQRLVTVVGPGGIGKTRLVTELRPAELAPFGAVLRAELAALAPRGELAAEVAGQLGFPSLESLLLRLGDERALLVLDNCEHVLAAAARLCERLLGAAPALHVLATSRAPLGVDGEELLLLGPLALPSGSDPGELESAATRLFEARARAGGARREPSPEERAAVAELCRRLDGVPLAIELAAARARSLTAGELLAQLGRRFDLLQRETPVGLSRHRSLRAAIDTSYELLDPPLQGFFRALGAFGGSFDAELAHAVAAPAGFDRLATLDALSRLVDRSLVAAEPQGSVTRYRLLDSLRHYAAEQARAAGEWEGAVGRFVGAMLGQADAIVAAGTRRWTGETLAQVFAQLGNLIAAIDLCIAGDGDAARAFRLALPLWAAIHQGRASEVADVCERALARWPEGVEPLRAELLAVAASASLPAGRVARAEELAAAALRAPSASGLAELIARRALGMAARRRGELAAAADCFRRGAEAARAAGLAPFARELAVCLAVTPGAAPLADALAALERAGEEAAAAGDAIGVVWAEVGKVHLLLRAGRLGEARRALGAAERAREGFAYPYGAMVTARLGAALTALEQGWPASAGEWRAALERIAAAGELAELALTLRAAAALARRDGDRVSEARLLAAVPPGIHVSVNGDLFDDEIGEGEPLATRPPGALRLARERLAELAAGAPARDGGSAEEGPGEAPESGELLRAGDAWSVRFAGRSAQVRHLKGLEDLAALLARPGEELHCLQLMGGGEVPGDAGPVLDAAARRSYQARIRELQRDVEEAQAHHDPGRAERAEAELDALVAQLAEGFGLGGRERRAGASAERARSAVTWRVRAAVKRIGEVHPELGRHLAHSLRTGTWCAYRPERPTAWLVQPDPPHGLPAGDPHGRSS
jgi:predicted ATPase